MAITMIISAANEAALTSYFAAQGLQSDVDGNPQNKRGFQYVPWQGSGLFTTVKATHDAQGVELTPAEYDSRYWALVDMTSTAFLDDMIQPPPVSDEYITQNLRSKMAGSGNLVSTPATPWTYWNVAGARIYEPIELNQWMTDNAMTGHVWQQGNSY